MSSFYFHSFYLWSEFSSVVFLKSFTHFNQSINHWTIADTIAGPYQPKVMIKHRKRENTKHHFVQFLRYTSPVFQTTANITLRKISLHQHILMKMRIL